MFWENYEIACRQIGKAPGAVAAEIGLSNATTTAWKKGATPKNATLKKIADYFDVSPESLLEEYPKAIANVSTVYVVADTATAAYLERIRQEYPELNVEKFRTIEELKATVAYLQALRGQK